MTLIEILVVVAILGLMMAALLFYLLGNDDRRCRLEAERLAAFLQGTANEAVMRDGATRAALSFSEQKGVQELAQMGAAVTGSLWRLDEHVGPHKIRQPVRMTLLTIPSGEVSTEIGWLLFDAGRTQGGVVILELNEAVWSVIVPGGEAAIYTERGRARLPQGTQSPKRNQFRPQGWSETLATGDPPRFPPAPSARPKPQEPSSSPPPPDPPSPTEEPDPPPEFPDLGLPQPDAALPLPDALLPEEKLDEAILDEGVPDEGTPPECQRDEDCIEPYERCHPEEQVCLLDFTGEGFRISQVRVTAPAELSEFIQAIFNRYIYDFDYNFLVYLDRNQSGMPGVEEPRHAWIIQGQPSGGGGLTMSFSPNPDLPVVQGIAQPMAACSEFDVCYEIQPMEEYIHLFLPKPKSSDGESPVGECNYQSLSVVASVQVRIRLEEGRPSAALSLTGIITPDAAHRLEIVHRETNMRFEDLLDIYNVDAEEDSNGDGQPDAWQFVFEGDSLSAHVVGNLAAGVGRTPPYCSIPRSRR